MTITVDDDEMGILEVKSLVDIPTRDFLLSLIITHTI